MQTMVLISAEEYDTLKSAGKSETAETPIQNLEVEAPSTQQEICQFCRITEPTLIRYRKRGLIPFLKIGSRVLYQKSAVIAALENKKGFKK